MTYFQRFWVVKERRHSEAASFGRKVIPLSIQLLKAIILRGKKWLQPYRSSACCRRNAQILLTASLRLKCRPLMFLHSVLASLKSAPFAASLFLSFQGIAPGTRAPPPPSPVRQIRTQLRLKDCWGRSLLVHAVLSGRVQVFDAALKAMRENILDTEVRPTQPPFESNPISQYFL